MESARRTGMEKLIQQQTEQVLLTYMLAVSVNNNASFQARADAKKALADLKTFIDTQMKISKDASYTAHLMLALDRMKTLRMQSQLCMKRCHLVHRLVAILMMIPGDKRTEL
jgi:hypothetical protein